MAEKKAKKPEQEPEEQQQKQSNMPDLNEIGKYAGMLASGIGAGFKKIGESVSDICEEYKAKHNKDDAQCKDDAAKGKQKDKKKDDA